MLILSTYRSQYILDISQKSLVSSYLQKKDTALRFSPKAAELLEAHVDVAKR